MKVTGKIALLALAMLGGCDAMQGVTAPPTVKGAVKLRANVVYLEVKDKDPKGEHWDPGSSEYAAPDIYYTISVDYEKRYESEVIRDKYLAQWLEASDFIEILPGKKIVFTFYDEDRSLTSSGALHNPDDYIGAISFTPEQLIQAANTGKEFSFEQIIKCKFQVANVLKKN